MKKFAGSRGTILLQYTGHSYDHWFLSLWPLILEKITHKELTLGINLKQNEFQKLSQAWL